MTPLATMPDDDLEDIFLKAVTEIDTQPLPPSSPQEICWPMVFLLLLFFCSYVGGTIIALLTYPTVTIDVVPVTTSVSVTLPLALPTRALAPVTLTTYLAAPTTGKGHQDVRAASGTLIFYNGLFTAQRIAGGTMFTGADGVKIATDAAVSIPAANPPPFAEASIAAHALQAGSAGNIAAGDINTTVANGVLVKNSPFRGGQEARDFQAVARVDLDGITGQTHTAFAQEMPSAFTLAPGEAVMPTDCRFKATANHPVGAEAPTLTVQAIETCSGIAYSSEHLSQLAIARFTQQTAPGAQYQLVGEVQVQLVGVTPLTVSCRGLWAYTLSLDYEQFLAGRIAGDSPQQAQKYLLQTGLFTRAMMPDTLPQDPAHIHFRVLFSI